MAVAGTVVHKAYLSVQKLPEEEEEGEDRRKSTRLENQMSHKERWDSVKLLVKLQNLPHGACVWQRAAENRPSRFLLLCHATRAVSCGQMLRLAEIAGVNTIHKSAGGRSDAGVLSWETKSFLSQQRDTQPQRGVKLLPQCFPGAFVCVEGYVCGLLKSVPPAFTEEFAPVLIIQREV